jgi:hypothetical protein
MMKSMQRIKSTLRKPLLRALLSKIAIALFLTLFFGIFALIPSIGCKIEVYVYRPYLKIHEWVGSAELYYAIITYNANATFNPLLYPASWLTGRAVFSGNYTMVHLPSYVGSVPGSATSPRWGKPSEIAQSATMSLILNELFINLPFLPVIFFVIELLNKRVLIAWFFGGVAGFGVAGLIGLLAGIPIAIASTALLLPRLRDFYSRKKIETTID